MVKVFTHGLMVENLLELMLKEVERVQDILTGQREKLFKDNGNLVINMELDTIQMKKRKLEKEYGNLENFRDMFDLSSVKISIRNKYFEDFQNQQQ